MANDELELPVFKNLDFRKAKLQDEIQALEAELATDTVSDIAKEKPRATRKQAV